MSSIPAQQIRACMNDEDSYRKNRKPLIEQIKNGNKLYINTLVDTVKTMVKDKKEQSIPRFISIYFLKDAMETQQPDLIEAVKEKLLKTLADIAKSKDTAKMFLPGTEDRIIKNFDQLLLESIIMWAEWFGLDSKKKPTKYQTTYEDVFSKIAPPKKFSFYTRKKKTDAPPADPNAPKAQTSSTPKPPQGSDMGPPSSGGRTNQKPSTGKTSSGKNLDANKIETDLKAMEGIKDLLMSTLTSGEKPDDMLMIVEDEIRKISKDFQDAMDLLLGKETTKKGQDLLNRVLEENSFASKYQDEYSKLQTGQISLDKFKEVMMNAMISSQKSPEKSKKKKESPKMPEEEKQPQSQFGDGDGKPPKSSKPPKKEEFDFQGPSFHESPANPPPKNKKEEFDFQGPSFHDSPANPPPKKEEFDFQGPSFHDTHSNPPPKNKSSKNKENEFDFQGPSFRDSPTGPPPKDNFSPGFDDHNSASRPKSKFHPPEGNNAFGGFESAPAGPADRPTSSFGEFGPNSGGQKGSAFGDFNSAPAESHFEPAFGKGKDTKHKNVGVHPPDDYGDKYDTREEKKTRENPFNNIWDEGNRSDPMEKKKAQKDDQGIGFEDFQDFNFDDPRKKSPGDTGGFNFDYDGGVRRTGTPNNMDAIEIFGDPDFSKKKEYDTFAPSYKKDDPFDYKSPGKRDFQTTHGNKLEKPDLHTDFGKPERDYGIKSDFGAPKPSVLDKYEKDFGAPTKSSFLDKYDKPPYKDTNKDTDPYKTDYSAPKSSFLDKYDKDYPSSNAQKTDKPDYTSDFGKPERDYGIKSEFAAPKTSVLDKYEKDFGAPTKSSFLDKYDRPSYKEASKDTDPFKDYSVPKSSFLDKYDKPPYKDTKKDTDPFDSSKDPFKTDYSAPQTTSILDRLEKIPSFSASRNEPGRLTDFSTYGSNKKETPITGNPTESRLGPPPTYLSSTSKDVDIDKLRQEGDRIRSELDGVKKHYTGSRLDAEGRPIEGFTSTEYRPSSVPLTQLRSENPYSTSIGRPLDPLPITSTIGRPLHGSPPRDIGAPLTRAGVSPLRSRSPSPPPMQLADLMSGMHFSPVKDPIRPSIGGPSYADPLRRTGISPSRTIQPSYSSPNTRLVGGPYPDPVGTRLTPSRLSPSRAGVGREGESAADIARRIRGEAPTYIGTNPLGGEVGAYSVSDIARRVREETRGPEIRVSPSRGLVQPAPLPAYIRASALTTPIESIITRPGNIVGEPVIVREASLPLPVAQVISHQVSAQPLPSMATTGRMLSSPPHFVAEEIPAIIPRENYVKSSFMSGMNFVPKYSPDLVMPVQEIQVPPPMIVTAPAQGVQMVQQEPTALPGLGFIPNLPNKYSMIGQSGQTVVMDNNFLTFQGPGVNQTHFIEHQLPPQPVIMNPPPEPMGQNPMMPSNAQTFQKASNLIERARRMRGEIPNPTGLPPRDVKAFSSSLGPSNKIFGEGTVIHPAPIPTDMGPAARIVQSGKKPSPPKNQHLSARVRSPLEGFMNQGNGLSNREVVQELPSNDPRVWNTTATPQGGENEAKPAVQNWRDVFQRSQGMRANINLQERSQNIQNNVSNPGQARNIDLGQGRAQDPNKEALEKEDARIRQMMGVPKLAGSDFQTPQGLSNQENILKGVTLERRAQKSLVGKKEKVGKVMAYDHGLFDQFTNLIYGYPYYRDVDAFKYACLLSRATLFESPQLQIASLTKNEGSSGPSDEIVKAIIHYTNKTTSDITEFQAIPHDDLVQAIPYVEGATLTPRYQLKQEFLASFNDLNCGPYVINLSYKHEGQSRQMNLVIPITITKFMRFKKGVNRGNFKSVWKGLKQTAVSIGYRNINAKFIRNPSEINSFFDALCDVTPALNPKSKKKYGGVFTLSDNLEYYLKFTLDSKRIKIMGSTGGDPNSSEQLIIQYLAFLLT